MPIPSSTASRTRFVARFAEYPGQRRQGADEVGLAQQLQRRIDHGGRRIAQRLAHDSNTGRQPLAAPRTTAARTSDAGCSNSRLKRPNTSCAGTFPTASAASVTTRVRRREFGSAELEQRAQRGPGEDRGVRVLGDQPASTAIGSPSSSHSMQVVPPDVLVAVLLAQRRRERRRREPPGLLRFVAARQRAVATPARVGQGQLRELAVDPPRQRRDRPARWRRRSPAGSVGGQIDRTVGQPGWRAPSRPTARLRVRGSDGRRPAPSSGCIRPPRGPPSRPRHAPCSRRVRDEVVVVLERPSWSSVAMMRMMFR